MVLWHFGEQVKRVRPETWIQVGELSGPAAAVGALADYGSLMSAGYLQEHAPDVAHPWGWEPEPVVDVDDATGRPVAVLVPAGPPAPIPEPSVEEALAAKIAAIQQHGAAVLHAAVEPYEWPEAVGWSQLAAEAKMFQEAAVLGPLLAAETAGMSEAEVLARCAEIEQKAAAFAAVRGQVVKARTAHTAAVQALAAEPEVTGAVVAAYDFTAAAELRPIVE
jgi:hypothetical protein